VCEGAPSDRELIFLSPNETSSSVSFLNGLKGDAIKC